MYMYICIYVYIYMYIRKYMYNDFVVSHKSMHVRWRERLVRTGGQT